MVNTLLFSPESLMQYLTIISNLKFYLFNLSFQLINTPETKYKMLMLHWIFNNNNFVNMNPDFCFCIIIRFLYVSCVIIIHCSELSL